MNDVNDTRPFFSGMNYGYLSKQGFYASPQAAADAEAMAAAGVKWVSLMVMLMQDTFYSTRVYRDFVFTPSDTELAAIIRKFHELGIKVLLKPVIDCHDSAWRGRIAFPPADDEQIAGVTTDYWSPWFASMTQAIVYYARLAEELGVEAFTVAQELHGTDSQTTHWLKTVDAVRQVYRGLLCVNIDGRSIPVSDALRDWITVFDAVGFSLYPALDVGASPTISEIVAALAPERDRMRVVADRVGRPIYFAECGARSVEGAASNTGEYLKVAGYDGLAQANYLEALLETFWDEPWWAGFQLWKWDEQQHRPHYHQPDGDTGFTIAGKPAQAALTRWSARARHI